MMQFFSTYRVKKTGIKPRKRLVALAFGFAVFMASYLLPPIVSSQLQAQIIKSARTELSDQKSRVFFGQNIYLTPDSQRQLSENIVLTRHNNNLHGPRQMSDLINLGLDNAPIWMIFSVTNTSATENWVLHFGRMLDGRHGLVRQLLVRNTDTGEVFSQILDDGSTNTGHEHIIGPAILLRVPKGKTQLFSVYLDMESGFANSIAPSFITEKRFVDSLRFGDLKTSLISVFFIGVMGVFASLVVLNNARSALYGLAHILFFACLFFVLNDVFLIDGLVGSASATGFFTLAMLSGILMSYRFLGIGKKDVLEIFSLAACGVFLILSFGAHALLPDTASGLKALLLYPPGIVAMVLMGGISFMRGHRGAYGGFYMGIGWFSLCVGAVISFLSAADVLYANAVLLNGLWIALLPHSFFVITAMLTKHKMQEEERQRIQLRENRAEQSMVRLQHSKESADQARLLRVIERERELMSELREREMQRTEEMRHAKNMADEANRAKSAFLAVVSHEIRTPMTGIMGMVRLLMDSKMSKEQCEYLGAVQSSGDSMMALLNDILDFEKIETGAMYLEQIECDLPRMAQGIMTLMSGHAMEKNIVLETDISPDFPTSLIGDPTRLRQILLNLVNNAIKFTDQGSVKIILDARPLNQDYKGMDQDYDIYFAVEDTGVGISKDAQDQLFTPFSQAETSTTRKYGGTGLGLAICRKLVEAMGSGIHVESQENVGSRFYFTVFMKESGEGTAQIADMTAVEPDAKEDAVRALPKMRVLVVEDNEMNARVLDGFLKQSDHDVTLSESAEEALKIIVGLKKNEIFDVILCDINLSGMDGMAMTKALRCFEDKSHAAIPVIAVTGDISKAQIESYYAANMNGFVAKPIDPGALNDVLGGVYDGVLEQNIILTDHEKGEDNAAEDSAKAPQPEKVKKKASKAKPKGKDVEGILNLDMIESLRSTLDEAAFDGLMDGFWEKADELIEALIGVERDKDIKEMRARAHELKGMAGNFGFSEIAAMAKEIEDSCKNNDIAIASQTIKKLPDANRRAKEAI